MEEKVNFGSYVSFNVEVINPKLDLLTQTKNESLLWSFYGSGNKQINLNSPNYIDFQLSLQSPPTWIQSEFYV